MYISRIILILEKERGKETHSSGSFGAGVRRARDTEGLLWFRLIRSLLALYAIVEASVEVSSGLADRKRAFFYRSGSHVRGRSTERTRLTGRLNSLSAIRAARTWLAFSFDSQLLSGSTFVPAFLAGYRLGGPRGLSKAAQQTGEAALVRLIKPVTAIATETEYVVVVLAGRTSLLAISRATSARTHRHAGSAGDYRARIAF